MTSSIADVMQTVDVRQTKVAGEVGRRIDQTIAGNLLKIDLDHDFLAPFVAKSAAVVVDYGHGPFIGVGKTLEGIVRLAAYSGNQSLLARKKHMVEELLRSQGQDGYIGVLPPDKRTWSLWDIHEQSFIIEALIADYRLFDAKHSLDAGRRLADYIMGRWQTKPADWEERLPLNVYLSTIGLKGALLALSGVTGDRRYLDFVVQQLRAKEWDQPIVLGRQGKIEGHVYSYCSHCLAQLELYSLQPEAKLLSQTQRAMDFLLAKDGMAITGGAGHDECWSNDQRGSGNLGETCATVYQMFLYDRMLRIQGDARWGDLVERTLYNTFFGAQSPDGRKIRYYTSFEGHRVYFGSDSYCCPGNFRRLVAIVPQFVCYRIGTDGFAVSLYTRSQVTIGTGGAATVVRQETDYPSSGRVTLNVDPAKPSSFPVMLRIPRWCEKPSASVNDKPVGVAVRPGEFLRIERRWQAGDTIELDLPMELRFVAGRRAQTGRAAVMRGPLVYTLNPETNEAVRDVDLDRLVLLTGTGEIIRSDSVRPGGTACRIKADLDRADRGAYFLTLSEFPDPDGQWTYFRVDDPKATVEDELIW